MDFGEILKVWKKIKYWLGFKDSYLVVYNLGGEKIEESKNLKIDGFGHVVITADKQINYNGVDEIVRIIKEKIAKEFPDIKNCKIVILNIIKLEG